MVDAGAPAVLPLPRAGVQLQSPEAVQHFAFSGLGAPEEHGRWTDGRQVRLVMRLAETPPGGVLLSIESLGFLVPGRVVEQQVEIRCNGTRLTEWLVLDNALLQRRLAIPAALLRADGMLTLDLTIPSCVQPAALGLGGDRRCLGLLLRRIAWEPLVAARRDVAHGVQGRAVGRESRKSFDRKLAAGFWDKYITGPDVLDIGWRGGAPVGSVVPIVQGATGVDLDYPGYDGTLLPFPDASQDAVYSSHCLEHIADFIKTIQEWHRVLRVGGHIITVVPSAHLYERRRRVPSRWNSTHLRVYTPAMLLAEFEAALVPNSYRVRHLAENDADYQYDFSPYSHPEGCYEIELVIEKIAVPSWTLAD